MRNALPAALGSKNRGQCPSLALSTVLEKREIKSGALRQRKGGGQKGEMREVSAGSAGPPPTPTPLPSLCAGKAETGREMELEEGEAVASTRPLCTHDPSVDS